MAVVGIFTVGDLADVDIGYRYDICEFGFLANAINAAGDIAPLASISGVNCHREKPWINHAFSHTGGRKP
jgi:hypothetical protein